MKQDYAAAVPKLERCLATVGQVYPKTNPEMVLAKSLLGLALTRSGRAAEAEPLLREALAEGEKVARGQLKLIGNLETALGECLLVEGKMAEAAQLLRDGHEEMKARLGEAHPSTRAPSLLRAKSETPAAQAKADD